MPCTTKAALQLAKRCLLLTEKALLCLKPDFQHFVILSSCLYSRGFSLSVRNAPQNEFYAFFSTPSILGDAEAWFFHRKTESR